MIEFVIAMMVGAAYQARDAPEIVPEEPERAESRSATGGPQEARERAFTEEEIWRRRMTDERDVAVSLARLLRALNDNQAHDREGVTVAVTQAELGAAGLVVGSPRNDEVMRLLQEAGALVADDEANARLANAVNAPEQFKFTRTALELLRKADEKGL